MKEKLELMLRWSPAEAGGSYVAKPNHAFWAIYKSQKSSLASSGVTIRKVAGDWRVFWVRSDAPAAPEVNEAANQPAVAWSEEQEAIFHNLKVCAGHLLIRARAGTGKTTTIKAGISYIPASVRLILYAVFGNRNAAEASEKITDPRVDIKTLHALGYFFIRQVWAGVKPDDNIELDRILELVPRDTSSEVVTEIKKLVGFVKNSCVWPTLEEVVDIANEHQIDCEAFEDPSKGGWVVERLAAVVLDVLKLSSVRNPQGKISFNDMVWLPVAMNWVKPLYEVIFIDEAQDMNLPQLLMAHGACLPGGRVIVVGDDRQAIYGFRGAVSDGLNMMKERLNAEERGLKTTYRCAKAIVREANPYVSDYFAAPSAAEGIVDYISEDRLAAQVKVGDAVLARANAPLMPGCLSLLRRGIPARIEGRDVGKQLSVIVSKLRAKSIPDFLRKVEAWGNKQRKRITGNNTQARFDLIDDQVATLQALAEGLANVSEIHSRISSLFEDSVSPDGTINRKPAVIFSSVHKAKGLEWDRVFLIWGTFFKRKGSDQQIEERNIAYVAITRAKNHLTYIGASNAVEARPAVTSTETSQP